MEPLTLVAGPPLSAEDLDTLRRAKLALESPSLTIKLTSVVGAPVEKMIGKLPGFATDKINDATQLALRKCLHIALRTLGKSGGVASAGETPGKPSNLLHKLAVATTGAAGGAFGLFALPVELPVTTTLMFRSICDIARSEGEDLSSAETQLQCLAVLGMGGGFGPLPGAGKDDGQADGDAGGERDKRRRTPTSAISCCAARSRRRCRRRRRKSLRKVSRHTARPRCCASCSRSRRASRCK